MLTNKIREMFPGEYSRQELETTLGYRYVQNKLRTYLNERPELGYDIIIHGSGPGAWAEFTKKEATMGTKSDPTKREVYWSGTLPPVDDFDDKYKDIMIDGKTNSGPWANMTESSWRIYGVGKLGTGYGQKYKKQADGRWLKIEG